MIAYPSKGDGMFVCESLIFRSDSNGEDLEGYAGAGLYDSLTLDTTETRKVDYGADRQGPLAWTLHCKAPPWQHRSDAIWLLCCASSHAPTSSAAGQGVADRLHSSWGLRPTG